jgi:hypothetical protein
MLIAPPAIADIAPYFPAASAAASEMAAVAAICHCRTVRIGLLRRRRTVLDLSVPRKA